jgi:LPXTG-motif cell wall-anchored protein
VFLQEACVIVDWERQNFTVAQARFDNLTEESLVPILSKASDESSNRTTTNETDGESQNSGLETGAIAGIVVGIVLFFALIGLGAWLYLRKRKSKTVTAALTTDEKPNDSSTQKTLYPASGSELESSNMLNEMPSDREPSEADGVAKWGRFSLHEAPTAPLSGMHGRSELSESHRRSELGDNFMVEVLGDERHMHELPANEWQR